ncbi:MAG TPA: tetratricopeptide repeat protein [Burkholderiales bacterium]|nr:tetratricopeptide repeat protein [Burkholderiales bacterium]
MQAAHALIIAFFLAASAAADPGDSGRPEGAAKDPVLEKVAAAAERKDWPAAQALLRDALAADSRNADYHNLYAYAIRRSDKPNLDLVFKHYNEALRIDPKHRGAHEYIGEAYLMIGNAAKAKEHLAALDRLCFFGCDEYAKLKKALAEFEAKKK